jgi:hypothetical protein
MAVSTVIATHTAHPSGQSRAEQILRGAKGLPLSEQIGKARTYLVRAAALSRMTKGSLSQTHDLWPEPAHVAKAIEAAQVSLEDARALSECLEHPAQLTFEVVLDQAIGVIATMSAWIWAMDWEAIPDAPAMCGSLDAAEAIIAECLELLDAAAQHPNRGIADPVEGAEVAHA